MSDPRQALDALMLAVVERCGPAMARELLADAAGFAMHPPTTDPSPEAWHSADVAFGFGSTRLVQELPDAIDRRAAEHATAAAMAKPTKKGTP